MKKFISLFILAISSTLFSCYALADVKYTIYNCPVSGGSTGSDYAPCVKNSSTASYLGYSINVNGKAGTISPVGYISPFNTNPQYVNISTSTVTIYKENTNNVTTGPTCTITGFIGSGSPEMNCYVTKTDDSDAKVFVNYN